MDMSSFSVSALTRRRPLTPVPSPRLPKSSIQSPETSSMPSRNDEAHHQQQQLQRTLNLHDLIFYGVGCSVGAGVYSLVGIGAAMAGPAIALSFFVCGVACIFTSLSYAEFAARVPLAGSAYTFAYVSFGELIGWLVGWNLTLGYGVSAAVVARSWAEYVVGFLEGFIVDDNNALIWLKAAPIPFFGSDYTCCPLSMVIIGLCTAVLVSGAKESARFNTAMTLLNLSCLGFVLLAGVGSGVIDSDNLFPVFPHGLPGMARGAGLVFFAYLGFDMVSCLSEEVKNPEQNMPIGIIGSLVASMTIYVSVAIVVVGMAPVVLLGDDVPIINALLANACCSHLDQLLPNADKSCLTYSCEPILHPVLYYGSRIISFGAIFGLTTATFACLMGQPRIFYSMAMDGLLFKMYAKVNPSTGVPVMGVIITGILTGLVACLIDLESLANVISLGTLLVFTFVNAGVIILRMQPSASSSSDDDDDTSNYLVKDESNNTCIPDNNNNTTDTINNTSSSASAVESSPLVRDPKQAAAARSIGIIKRTSGQIRKSLRRMSSSFAEGISSNSSSRVDDNGTKPTWITLLYTICTLFNSISFSQQQNDDTSSITIMRIICFIICIICIIILYLLPMSLPPNNTFTCPLVPGIPLLGITCNTYMMGSMDSKTWWSILLWLLIGILFYFSYGIHHSELRIKKTSSSTTTTTDDQNSNTAAGNTKTIIKEIETSPLLPPISIRQEDSKNNRRSSFGSLLT